MSLGSQAPRGIEWWWVDPASEKAAAKAPVRPRNCRLFTTQPGHEIAQLRPPLTCLNHMVTDGRIGYFRDGRKTRPVIVALPPFGRETLHLACSPPTTVSTRRFSKALTR